MDFFKLAIILHQISINTDNKEDHGKNMFTISITRRVLHPWVFIGSFINDKGSTLYHPILTQIFEEIAWSSVFAIMETFAKQTL